jgi:hypothetical protein
MGTKKKEFLNRLLKSQCITCNFCYHVLLWIQQIGPVRCQNYYEVPESIDGECKCDKSKMHWICGDHISMWIYYTGPAAEYVVHLFS